MNGTANDLQNEIQPVEYIHGFARRMPDDVSPVLLHYGRAANYWLKRAGHDGIQDCSALLGTNQPDLEPERLRFLVLQVGKPMLSSGFHAANFPNIAGRIEYHEKVDTLRDHLADIGFGRLSGALYPLHPELFSAAQSLLNALEYGSVAFEADGPHPRMTPGPCPTCGQPWEDAPGIVPPLDDRDARLAMENLAQCIHILGHGPNNQWFRHDRALRRAAALE